MAEQFTNEGSSSKHSVSGESSDSNVELNVKTLDSRIYRFVVDKNMPVSAFKDKIANEIGLSAGQQRLIFRGKVLKDEHRLSEYLARDRDLVHPILKEPIYIPELPHVENGHTLHLVERQQTQSQQPGDSGSGEPNSSGASRGSDANANANANANAPRGRVGQISHSVVLGTYNVGDQGEGGALDISRVIGSVLNSIGLGNLAQPNGSVNMQPPVSLNVAGQGPGPAVNEAERARSNAGGQNQSGTQPSTGPSPTMPQVMQIPLGGAAIPIPSLLSPIPDSLHTLVDFMNRMEQSLARNGYQANTSRTNSAQLPGNTRGLPTLEALGIVLRQAERLLSGQTVAALSHIAGRLEQDGASVDTAVRGQIQAEAAQIGIAMQHLGALFLELGRTMLTLRLGQSPGESFVHSGPSVYISPSGPNPIMVQPFPLQTTSLFGTSVPPANPMPFGPVGVGNPPRHINIHIHAGGSLTPMGPGGRVNGGDGLHGERGNANGSTDSTAARNLGNIFSGTIPPHSSGMSASGAPQPSAVPGSQSNPLASLVAQISSQIRSLAAEVPEETQIPSGQTAASIGNSSVGSTTSTSERAGDQIEEPSLFSTESRASRHQSEHKPEPEGIKAPKVEDSKGSAASTNTLTGLPGSSSSSSEDVLKAEAGPSTVESRDVPIGLGLGGLERKKRGKQPKTQAKGEEAGPATTLTDKTDASTSSRQILQTLLSRGSNVQPTGTEPSPSSGGQEGKNFGSSGGQVADIGSIMSQVLQSPMLNGLLSGVSEQTGAGSPDVLRNMLQQVTQNPAMMNAVGQIAQQINPQDLGGMFGGMGGQGASAHGGGIDLSSMMQQMMPIVSQALGGGGGASGRAQPFADLVQDFQRQTSDGFTSSDERDNRHVEQVGLQGVVRHIQNLDPPQDVFRSMAENAATQLHDNGTSVSHDILSALCEDDDLANEYAEILRRDLSKHRVHDE